MIAFLLCMKFASPCCGEEFDFQRLLLGLTADSREEQLAAERNIRIELKGREGELFDFVVAVLHDDSGSYDAAHITEGLRALIVLNSFSESHLKRYRDLLIREAKNVEVLKSMSEKRVSKIASERERLSLTKRLAFVESGFYIFEQHGSPLPREVAAAFLPFNDRGIIEPVIRWYRANGTEADIPMLISRAEDLENLGGTILAGAIEEAILNIQARTNAADEDTAGGDPSTDPNGFFRDSSELTKPVRRSNSFRLWIVIAIPVFAALGFTVWRRKRHQR